MSAPMLRWEPVLEKGKLCWWRVADMDVLGLSVVVIPEPDGSCWWSVVLNWPDSMTDPGCDRRRHSVHGTEPSMGKALEASIAALEAMPEDGQVWTATGLKVLVERAQQRAKENAHV